jgi:hypothetical protein
MGRERTGIPGAGGRRIQATVCMCDGYGQRIEMHGAAYSTTCKLRLELLTPQARQDLCFTPKRFLFTLQEVNYDALRNIMAVARVRSDCGVALPWKRP